MTALTMLVVAVGLATPATAQPPGGIRLGVVEGMFRDVPPPLVHAAATPFRDLLKRQTGLVGELDVFADCDQLASRLQEKKTHVGVFHGFEWAWVKDRHPDLIPLAVSVPARRFQAALVVHADSKAQVPANLKGAVALPLGSKAHCYLFAERLAETLPAGTVVPTHTPKQGPDDVLDLVIDGKAQAAVIDVATLDAFRNDRPGRGAQLRVLAQSDPFPYSTVVYRKDTLTPEMVTRIKSGLLNTKNEPTGRAFLFMWKLRGFEEVPAAHDAELRAVAAKYPAPRAAMGMTMNP
ncbi:MAG: PhnD/SsuA/transferrin family substrate-binding protein [Gemmataceae bacterium]